MKILVALRHPSESKPFINQVSCIPSCMKYYSVHILASQAPCLTLEGPRFEGLSLLGDHGLVGQMAKPTSEFNLVWLLLLHSDSPTLGRALY